MGKGYTKIDNDTFRLLLKKFNGNLSKVSEAFHINRTALYRKINSDEDLKTALQDARKTFFDECLSTARIVSLGIPMVEDGKIVGWQERPDSNMLRYLIGKLGADEGFGESIDITSKGKEIAGFNIEIIDRREDVRSDGEENGTDK